MDIRALRYFVAVVEQQSFSRAAEHLHVTQPTVSKMIQQLEQSLELTLLERSGKRFTLTDAGQVVLQRGRALLAMHEEMGVELEDLQQLRRGDLRLGVTQQSHASLAPLLAAYHRRHPHIELKLFEGGSHGIEADLRSGVLEMGTLLDHPSNQQLWQEFDSFPLVRSPMCLLAPKDSAWRSRKRVALRELADSPFIFYGEGFALNEIIADACLRAGFKPHYRPQWSMGFRRLAGAAGCGHHAAAQGLLRHADTGPVHHRQTGRTGAGLESDAGVAPWRPPVVRRAGVAGPGAQQTNNRSLTFC
jgi:DNA-binding transcriptional LysR family regulator